MNLFVMFDYVYYRIAFFEEKQYSPLTGGEFFGIISLSAFQFINALSLLDFYIPMDEIVKEHSVTCIILLLVIYGLNFIRYKRIVKYAELSLKWDKEARKIRIIKAFFVLVYFLLSFVLFFYLALDKNNMLSR